MGTVHHVMGVDRPLSAMATGGKYAIKDIFDTPDTLMALWEYPGGWTLEYTLRQANGYNADRSNYGIMFHGTDATMFLDRSGFEIHPEGDRAKPRTAGKPRVDSFMPEALSIPHIRNFLDCIKSRKRPAADIEIGHRATITPHLANIAMRSGERLKWDAEAETLVGGGSEAIKLLGREYRKPYVLPEA
jgi:hypothetical protein